MSDYSKSHRVNYDVTELARVTALSVDTIRYYQSMGLLPGPRREGRCAVYDDTHRDRVERIRTMTARGFSLKAIRALLDAGDASPSDRLLLTAIEREAPPARYTAEEMARRLHLPRTVLAAVERTGLVESEEDDGSRRYSEADLEVGRGAMKLLRYGFPLSRLLRLAVRHDRAVRRTVDEAIELFDGQVRKPSRKAQGNPDAVAEAFRELLPVVTALVAHHFQRVLVHRAMRRLKKNGAEHELRVALKAAARTRVGFRWS